MYAKQNKMVCKTSTVVEKNWGNLMQNLILLYLFLKQGLNGFP